MTAQGVGGMATAASEALRALWVLILVIGGATVTLVGLDALPRWLQGEPRGVRRVASVEEAERRLRARVALPSFFPETLRWPPASVRVTRDDGGAVALVFQGRDGSPALVLAQAIRGAGPIPSGLLPEAAPIQRQSGPVGEDSVLSRVVGDDGTLWNQLEWVSGGRRHVLRGKGSLEEMVRMARSVHGGTR